MALIAHAENAVSAGGTTTPAQDCTGANIIFLATATTFVGPTPTDSSGNTWTQISSGATHNTSYVLWYCYNPVVSAAQTFSQASNGSGFNQSIAMAAFDGAVLVLGSALDGSPAISFGDPPTPAQSGPVTPSQNNCLVIAVGVTEQGSGLGPTPNGGFIVAAVNDEGLGQAVALAYLLEATPSTTDPLWTLGSGALHWGAIQQSTFNSGSATSIPVPKATLAFTTYAPTISIITTTIPVPLATMALTTYAPTINLTGIAVPVRALAITTYAPSITGNATVPVPAGSLHLTTYAPTVFIGTLGPCADRFGPKIYFWEPSYLDRPEDTFLRATDWDAAGYDGLKFVQGLIIEADTEGQTREILLQGDQADIETLTINHNGQIEKPYSLNQPVLKHLLRLLPTDDAFWRLFNVRWVYEPAPEYAREWKTQGTDHDLPGFQFLGDGYIAHASTTDITFNVTVDGTTFTYIIPNSGGVYVKTYILFGIKTSGKTTKGKLFTYELTSAEPFQLYQKDCEVRVHDWSGGEYLVKQPFGDISRVYGARI